MRESLFWGLDEIRIALQGKIYRIYPRKAFFPVFYKRKYSLYAKKKI